ncbi:MAG: membrane dipeptidase [Anaerolineae bacterium]|nr:membrane dipeptidase [Anaerolineae bacterium]
MTYIIVDAHLDMAYNALLLGRDLTLPLADIRMRERHHAPGESHVETCLVSIPALLEGRIAVVGASIYAPPAHKGRSSTMPAYRTADEAHALGAAQLDYYRRLVDEDGRVQLLLTEKELDVVLKTWETEQPQVGLFLVMEGADPIRNPPDLPWWIERGLRGITLAWSSGSRYAGGCNAPGSLTDEGRELLDVMADYHLLLDISHLWEDAVYEVLERYPGPVVATHANARAFVDTPRQLSNDSIRRIADHEGVIGVLPFNSMLDPLWRRGEPRLPLSRVVEVIDHICQITGVATAVGLGSDFDGGLGQESVPAGLESIADLGKIGALLAERGYSDDTIKAILSDNWLRVFRSVLRA